MCLRTVFLIIDYYNIVTFLLAIGLAVFAANV
ncbi:hypothetical protein JOE49_003327 [Paenibacillus sp. PvR133]|nr:hypothetical protein [Paenibacillus sp. PvR133]